MLKSFFKVNRKLCQVLNKSLNLPHLLGQGNVLYLQHCAEFINTNRDKKVLDIGAGRKLYFADLLIKPCSNTIIGCDISLDEVQLNGDLDEVVICDASKEIPLPDQSVDLVTSYMCMEHLPDTKTFLNEAVRVLKPGSPMIFYFAGGLAPHALINRLFPPHISKRIIYFFLPGSENRLGFPAYYDGVTLSRFSQLLRERGVHIDNIYVNYNFREYLSFFLPLYLVGLVIDYVRYVLQCKEYACSYIFVTRLMSDSH